MLIAKAKQDFHGIREGEHFIVHDSHIYNGNFIICHVQSEFGKAYFSIESIGQVLYRETGHEIKEYTIKDNNFTLRVYDRDLNIKHEEQTYVTSLEEEVIKLLNRGYEAKLEVGD